MENQGPPIIDCHQHFIDSRRLRYPVFMQRSAGFEALVGDYGALPRVYLPEDYARDVNGLGVVKSVWAEFISDDPVGEVRWVQELAHTTGQPQGMIGLVDFSSPEIERTLDLYTSIEPVRAVRQHLGWHPTNPLLRYAPLPELLSSTVWQNGLALLRGSRLCCEIEIFGSQLPEFASVAVSYPDIQFVLPVMGWPIDVTNEGRETWKRALSTASACDNVAIKIFGMECIFGLRWTVAQIRPWILDAVELFGPDRCMFASHLPICKLACSVQQLYAGYLEVIADFSASEKRQMLHDTAAEIYGL